MSLLSMPWGPERAHANGEKQDNQKNFKQRADSHGRLSWVQIWACLLTLFVQQKGHTAIPGWPKKKKKEILFLDSNPAHVLMEFQADMGEYQASRGRDMGVPQNINITKCSLKKHLRGRWYSEVLNNMIPFWGKKAGHKSCLVVYYKALRSPSVLKT